MTMPEEEEWLAKMKLALNQTDFVRVNRNVDEENFKIIMASLIITSAVMGLMTNLFILFLSIFHIKGDYRHFIINLAIVDILCALLFAFMGYLNLHGRHARRYINRQVMTYSAFAFYGSFGVMICALVPVSLSRVVAAGKPQIYEKLFSGSRAMLFCFVFDMIPIALLAIICTSRHDIARVLFMIYAFLTFIAYLVTFVSNSLVFRLVASHIKVVQLLHDKKKLLETRQVAIAALTQAIVPLVCQVPAFLTLSSSLLLIQPIVDGKIILITQFWLASSPLLDALITIFVIKLYRIKTVNFWSKFLPKRWSSKRKQSFGYLQALNSPEIYGENFFRQ